MIISGVQIQQAVDRLNADGVVGMPTETVYGLAAKINSAKGLELIFSTKQRPFFDPLIVHVSSVEQAKSLTAKWPPAAQILAQKFWPGPLTLVLEKSTLVSDLITSGLTTVGVRMPQHLLALQLIEKVGVPLAAPSANRFGKTSPTIAQHVQDEFQNSVLVIDGGPCKAGIESTIVAIREEDVGTALTLLRPGVILPSEIESELLEAKILFSWRQASSRVEAPGQMKHHYMPEIPLIVANHEFSEAEILKKINDSLQAIPDEVEGIKMVRPSKISSFQELHLGSTPIEAARKLYSELRRLGEGKQAEAILFRWDQLLYGAPDSINAEWLPVLDRLLKAASLRFF